MACVRTWVDEEDTRESVREATQFPQDGEAVTEPDVPEKEVDIKTVTVTPAEGGGGLEEAPLDVERIWPALEAMVHTASQ